MYESNKWKDVLARVRNEDVMNNMARISGIHSGGSFVSKGEGHGGAEVEGGDIESTQCTD